MKNGSRWKGFTIVETLIVLAVTGILFVSVAALIGGKQAKTQFLTGARDLQSRLQQTIDDVSNGYYLNDSNVKCTPGIGGPNVSASPAQQGGNTGCIFMGKVLQFNVDGLDPEVYQVLSVVGLQNNGTQPVKTMAEAKPLPITLGGLYATETMPFGMTTAYVKYDNTTNVGAVAILSSLGNLNNPGPSQQVDVYPVTGTSLGQPQLTNLTAVQSPAAPVNPSGGVQICVKSGSTSQWALYTIGGMNKQLTVSLDIKGGANCT